MIGAIGSDRLSFERHTGGASPLASRASPGCDLPGANRLRRPALRAEDAPRQLRERHMHLPAAHEEAVLSESHFEPAAQQRPLTQLLAPGHVSVQLAAQHAMSARQESAPPHVRVVDPPFVTSTPWHALAWSQRTLHIGASHRRSRQLSLSLHVILHDTSEVQRTPVHELGPWQVISHARPGGQTTPVQLLHVIMHVSPLHVPPREGQLAAQLASDVPSPSPLPASEVGSSPSRYSPLMPRTAAHADTDPRTASTAPTDVGSRCPCRRIMREPISGAACAHVETRA